MQLVKQETTEPQGLLDQEVYKALQGLLVPLVMTVRLELLDMALQEPQAQKVQRVLQEPQVLKVQMVLRVQQELQVFRV